jgi:ribosomal protein S27E
VKTAQCPSCGAPVGFRSASSLYAVCEFCHSTLLRDGDDLKNLGRMAELMDDPSRIQIGSEGRFRGGHFAVIGRIQLKYDAGLWNEWHILFDDQRSAWLSEAGGEYVVSSLVPVDGDLPAFEALKPEMPVTIAGRIFFVSDLQTARCIAGAGELPFKVESGYDVNTADLCGNDRFVTIDYSETPPLVFVGYPAQFDDLGLTNLRPGEGAAPRATIKATAFNCPHCAAPLTVHSPAIESIGCVSCGSIIGVEHEGVRLLAKAAQQMKIVPWLPLGSTGTLNGVEWEVIGFLRRSTRSGGVDYAWSEYLLFNTEAGFAWLTEYDGHWNFARTLSKPPSVARGQTSFWHQRELFKRFSSGMAEVIYVEGEFYWRVAVGESCLVEDYICPPRMLSRELTDKEVTWSEGEYLEPGALCAAFGITAPPPKRLGVYANQPNPLAERHRAVWQLFWPLVLVATCVQLVFVFFVSSQAVLKQSVVLSALNEEAALTTQEFVLPEQVRSLRVTHSTDVDNNWVGLNTTLVEKNTGEAYQGAQEISYYSGSEGGESWSEGSRDDAIAFRNVPAGTYYLNVEYELGGDRNLNPRVVDTIEVIRNPVPWSNYVLVILFLLAFPLFSRWRRNAFEAERWNESDLGGGDSEDEDE